MPDIAARLAEYEAHAAIRRVAARYMALCDEPPTALPGPDFKDIFTRDLVWEGVGAKAAAEFARVEGRDAVLHWFDTLRNPPKYVSNVHMLTSEAIAVEGSKAIGSWVLFQTAARASGDGEVRIARLAIRFQSDEDVWRIAHFQTESLFRFDVRPEQLAALVARTET